MGLEITVNVSDNVAEKLQRQAHQQQRALEEIASELLTDAVIEQEIPLQPDMPVGEIEFDAESIAVARRIMATPPDPNAIIPPKGSLQEALEESL